VSETGLHSTLEKSEPGPERTLAGIFYFFVSS